MTLINVTQRSFHSDAAALQRLCTSIDTLLEQNHPFAAGHKMAQAEDLRSTLLAKPCGDVREVEALHLALSRLRALELRVDPMLSAAGQAMRESARKAYAPPHLEPGTFARLRSGGPLLLVERLEPSATREGLVMVACAWLLTDGSVWKDLFQPATLEHVPNPDPAQAARLLEKLRKG